MIGLNQDNYHSAEANRAYWSNSQYKAWSDCPAREAAIVRGEWSPDYKTALLVGSYVDAALLTPDRLQAMIERNRDAYQTKKGELRSDFALAEKMIERAKRDELFMGALDGNHQQVATWEMFGVKWRAMFDCVDPVRKVLVDLKTCRDLEPSWSAEHKMKLPFYETWQYWRQMAIYREGYKSLFGEYPEVVAIAAVTKQSHPRLKLFHFDNDDRFAHELDVVEQNIARLDEMRQAAISGIPFDFHHCGQCDYCADTMPAEMETADSLVW